MSFNFVRIVLLSLAAASVSYSEDLVVAEEPADSLARARAALAGRDLTAAKEAIVAAKKAGGEGAMLDEIERVDELRDYVQQFWEAVDRGARTLGPLDELMLDDDRIVVSEVDNGKLSIRIQGKVREFTFQTIPTRISLLLADRVMKLDVPQNKVFVGAFLAMDKNGNRKVARRYWEEAGAAGVNVSRLLPELELPLPAPAIEIPPLTPVVKNALSDKNWSLRLSTKKGWQRKSLNDGDVGTRNDEGYLAIALPSDESQYQVVTRRPYAAEVKVRMIVKDLPEGATFGLYSADGADAGYFVELPAGTMLIEFSRLATGIECKVADREAEVRKLGEPAARLTGNIGITAPAGAKFSIAWFEVVGR